MIITKKQKIGNILRKIELPDPNRSYEDYLKCRHDDLHDMSELELWKEEKRTELALSITDKSEAVYIDESGQLIFAEEWLLQRLARIRKIRQEGF